MKASKISLMLVGDGGIAYPGGKRAIANN